MFDSGLLTICDLQQVAVNGGMPTKSLVEKGRAFYGNRTISVSRMYQAMGADRQIDKLVRVPFDTDVLPDDYIVFEDDTQFRVDAVTDVIVRRDLRAVELTLIKLGENYDVEFAE